MTEWNNHCMRKFGGGIRYNLEMATVGGMIKANVAKGVAEKIRDKMKYEGYCYCCSKTQIFYCDGKFQKAVCPDCGYKMKIWPKGECDDTA